MKKIIIISIILVALLLTGASFTQDVRSYRPIDQLITGFMMLPSVDYKTGHLKRDKATLAFLLKDAEAIMGYCLKYYDVAVGYDLSADLCDRQHILPPPQILSVNTLSSEVLGKYSRQECDTLDHRDRLLLPVEMVAHGQKTLSRFLRLICPREGV